MQYRAQVFGVASVLCLLGGLVSPSAVRAQVPLTRADVEAIYNNVVYLPESGNARSARLSDWLDLGDAIRTAAASRADLRFNDGSLARVGERATFWFVPNTRTFRLSNGTALFLVPPGRGPSTIETPSVVTGIQGTGVIVRHIVESAPTASEDSALSGRTIVMALTNNPGGPVKVSLPNDQSVDLVAGEMAIAANGILEVFEFDLQLFYETSPLVADLHLDDPGYSDTGSPTDPVRQETLDGLAQQANFVGDTVLNPEILDIEVTATAGLDRQVAVTTEAMTTATSELWQKIIQHQGETNRLPRSVGRVEQRDTVVLPNPESTVHGFDPSLPGQADLIPGDAASLNNTADVGAGAPPPGVVAPPAPAIPVEPGIPAMPAEPGEPGEPAMPAEPAEPAEPGEPGEPAEPADPAEPGGRGGGATPADPGEPGEPATPAIPPD